MEYPFVYGYAFRHVLTAHGDVSSTIAPKSIQLEFITIVIRSRRLDKFKLLTGCALHSLFELDNER